MASLRRSKRVQVPRSYYVAPEVDESDGDSIGITSAPAPKRSRVDNGSSGESSKSHSQDKASKEPSVPAVDLVSNPIGSGKRARSEVPDTEDEDVEYYDSTLKSSSEKGNESNDDLHGDHKSEDESKDEDVEYNNSTEEENIGDDDLDDNYESEDESEDEIVEAGDDDVVQGPDDDDDDDYGDHIDDDASEAASPTTGPTTNVNSAFAKVLRNVLTSLQEWAKTHNWFDLESGNKPMSFGYWVLLGKVSIDFLEDLFLPGVPAEVQALFDKDSWLPEDFLSLPSVSEDDCQGLYCNFATGDIRKRSGGDPLDAYIGSANCL